MRTGAAAGGASAWSAEGVWVLTGTLGKPGPARSPAWRPEDGMISGAVSVGREHAMEADEMQPWTRDKRGQALHELQR